MAEKIPAGAAIQIQLLKSNFPLPKWESSRASGMARVWGSWNEDWEKKEKQKVIQKIAEFREHILQVYKDDFYLAKGQLEKRNRPFPEGFNAHLIPFGMLAVLGFEELLLDPQVMDQGFIQDIISLAEEGECREGAAFALLGLEIAQREGRFIPPILKVFDETHSLRLARHLGKVSWDPRVGPSLARGTAANFLITEMDGLSLKYYDGPGLLSALSLLELNDERGLAEMAGNLLRLKDSQLPDKLLVYAGDAVVPGLIDALKQENINNSRGRAAACLGAIGNQLAVQPLLALLEDEIDFCAIAAAKALGELGDPAAIPGLLKTLGHKSLLVRTAGSAAIKKLKDVWTADPFIAALADEDERIALFAIDAVGGLKSTNAIESLAALADSGNKKVRKAAEKVLKKMR